MATWAGGERITADKLTSIVGDPVIRETNSAAYTTETLLDTLTVPVVDGRRYKIIWDGMFFVTGSLNTVCRLMIRENNITGTILQLRQVVPVVLAQGEPVRAEAFYTATSTENKTFVATGIRATGGGTVTAQAVGAPTMFYAENA